MIEHRSWAYAPGIIAAWWRGRRKVKAPIRRMLSEADFAALVRGEEVTQDGVTIALGDIGFHAMSTAINAAWEEQMRTEI